MAKTEYLIELTGDELEVILKGLVLYRMATEDREGGEHAAKVLERLR
jgi:hypothetical protein